MGFCLRKQELENRGGEGHRSSGPEVLAILPVFIGERALALEPSNPEFHSWLLHFQASWAQGSLSPSELSSSGT